MRFTALALVFVLGCEARHEVDPGRVLPESPEQAASMRGAGTAWTNAEIRAAHLRLAAATGPADTRWKRDGVPSEERARRAFKMRHDARLTTRAMMGDRRQVLALEQRDLAKYGHADGPT